MPFPEFAAGQRVTAGQLTGLRWNEVLQGSDITVNNSTTYVNTNLTFTTVANARYRFELLVGFSGPSSTADIKFDWTTPVGASVTRFLWGPGLDDVNAATNITHLTMRRIQSGTDSPAGNAGGSRAYLEHGYIDAGDGGAVTLKFAQNVATAADTIFQGQSVLYYIRTE